MKSSQLAKALRNVVRKEALYAFDFDGTLSPVVRDHQKARLTPRTRKLLSELSALVPVVVISGRGLADLRTRVRSTGVMTVGNHGIETRGMASAAGKSRKASRRWKTALNKSLKAAPLAGVEIEDKTYSLSIHYRKCRDRKRAMERLSREIAALTPKPRVIGGKAVYNLLPVGTPHKGDALRWLMKDMGLKHGLFIGDDITDEDVFESADRRLVTIRIGEKGRSAARYRLKDRKDVDQLLRLLIDLLR